MRRCASETSGHTRPRDGSDLWHQELLKHRPKPIFPWFSMAFPWLFHRFHRRSHEIRCRPQLSWLPRRRSSPPRSSADPHGLRYEFRARRHRTLLRKLQLLLSQDLVLLLMLLQLFICATGLKGWVSIGGLEFLDDIYMVYNGIYDV